MRREDRKTKERASHALFFLIEGTISCPPGEGPLELPPCQPPQLSLGLRSLQKEYTSERLEAACRRALRINASSYTSIRSILKNNLDGREFDLAVNEDSEPLDHQNIRGPLYFVTQGQSPVANELVVLGVSAEAHPAREAVNHNQEPKLEKDVEA